MRTRPTFTYSALSDLAIHLPGLIRSAITTIGLQTSQCGNFRIVLAGITASSSDFANHKMAHFEFNNAPNGWLAITAEL